MEEREPLDHPVYEPQPETPAEPLREPLPVRPRPSDEPVPRMSGGGPSLVDEPPDEESALGHDEFREDSS